MRIFTHTTSGLMIVVPVLVALFSSLALFSTVRADEVKIDHQGLDLVGELGLAKGKSLRRHGVIVLLHDVMASHQQAQVADLHMALVERGQNVLSINLSLGLDGRTGRYDCAVEQDHLFSDALPEIHTWVKWLQRKKVSNIALLGIGLGADQIALYGSKTTQKAVRSIILLAPNKTTKEQTEQRYQQFHGASLQNILFEAEAKIGAQQGGTLLEKVGFLICPHARVTARSFASYYRENLKFDTTTLIAKISRPTLVIAAELGDTSEDLVAAMQQIEARANLRLDVIEGADTQFSGVSMQQVADRVKLFRDETRGK